MEWSDEKSLLLIQLYRENSILWNPVQKDYKNTKIKHDCWNQIAVNLNIDSVNVKKKMERLLGSYRRERIRQEESHRSGAATNELYTSRWFAFNDMQFLADKFKPRQTKDTLHRTVKEKLVDFSEDQTEYLCSPKPNEEVIASTENSTEENEQSSQQQSFQTPPLSKNISRKKCKFEKLDEEDKLNETFSIMESLSEKKNVEVFSVFGNYIESKLKIFNPRERAILENEIQNLIFKAEMRRQDLNGQPLYIQESLPQTPLNYNSQYYQPTHAHIAHQVPIANNITTPMTTYPHIETSTPNQQFHQAPITNNIITPMKTYPHTETSTPNKSSLLEESSLHF